MADYKISISIGARTDELKRKTDEASGILDSFKGEITARFNPASFLSIGGAIGAGFAAGEMAVSAAMSAISSVVDTTISQITNAFDALDQVGDVAGQLGVSSSELLALHGAAEEAGTSAEVLDQILGKLRINLAQGKGESAIKKLGLDLQTLRNMDPAAAFQQVAVALAGVSNDTERAGLAVEIMGKSAGAAFAMYNANLAETIERHRTYNGLLTDADIQKVGDADQAVKNLGTAWAGIGKILASELAPTIQGVAEILTSLITDNLDGIRNFAKSLNLIPPIAIVVGDVLKGMFAPMRAGAAASLILLGQVELGMGQLKAAAEDATAPFKATEHVKEYMGKVIEAQKKAKEQSENDKKATPFEIDEKEVAKVDVVANKIREMQRQIEQVGMSQRDAQLASFLEDNGATGAQLAEINALREKLALLDQEEAKKKQIADEMKKKNDELIAQDKEAQQIKEAIKSKEEKLAERLARVEQLRQDDLLTELEALREKERLLAEATGDPLQSEQPTQQASLATRFSSAAQKIIFDNQAPKDPVKEAQLRVQESQLDELKGVRSAIERAISRNKEDELGGII